MTTCKLSFDVGDQGLARDLNAALTELVEPPPLAVTMFDTGAHWRVEAYGTDAGHCAAIASRLAGIVQVPAERISVLQVKAADWVTRSQAALPPVIAGRFAVHGRHDRARIPRGPNAIEIEAGEAFGTGHHATTRCCLLAIAGLAHERDVRRMLDLGCGSGVLAIAAARAWPRADIVATDRDPLAVATARTNCRLNGVGRRIDCQVADGVPRRLYARGQRPDLIVANILAGPLMRLARSLARATQPLSPIVLSGILTSQAPALLATYRAHGFILRAHARDAGWSTLVLFRRRDRPVRGKRGQPMPAE